MPSRNYQSALFLAPRKPPKIYNTRIFNPRLTPEMSDLLYLYPFETSRFFGEEKFSFLPRWSKNPWFFFLLLNSNAIYVLEIFEILDHKFGVNIFGIKFKMVGSFWNFDFSVIDGWRSKFGTTECRATNISEFQNYEFDSFIFEFIFSLFINCKILIFQVVKLIIFKFYEL